MAVNGTEPFLPRLILAIQQALGEPQIKTHSFVLICKQVLPVLDCLGTVFQFAKLEFATKNDSLEKAEQDLPLLDDIIRADKKRGVVTKRGSCARNLHRLMSAIQFIQILIEELTASSETTLRVAATKAYEIALSPIHTRFIRGVVSAGMMALPTRDSFLTSLGETDETAQKVGGDLIALVDKLTTAVCSLYDDPMPASTTWLVQH